MGEILCPLIHEQVHLEECFDMCMVAEGMAPDRTADPMLLNNSNCKEICNNCINHKE